VKRPYLSIFLLINLPLALSMCTCTAPCRSADLQEEDLGFNTTIGGSKLGEIADITFIHREQDARFVINNLPVWYREPSTSVNLTAFGEQLVDLETTVAPMSDALARANVDCALAARAAHEYAEAEQKI
jgi:hypothetical protein